MSESATACILQLAETSDISLQHLEVRAKRTAGAFQERLMSIPLAMPQMCAALHLLDAGEPNCSDLQSLL